MEDFFECRYFRLRRILMSWIGQWPYETSFGKSIRRVVTCFLFLSVINAELKSLFERVKRDWKAHKLENEIKILETYAENGRLFGVFYLSGLYIAIGIFSLATLRPIIVDAIAPLKSARVRELPFVAAYGLDEEKYYFTLLGYIFIVAVVIHTVAVATDMTLITFILHSCALFGILGNRLEHLFDKTVTTDESSWKIDETSAIADRIGRCVEYHREATKYVKAINSCYVYSYLAQLLFVVLILAGLLLRLCEKLTPLEHVDEAIACAVHATGLIIIIFLNMYPAQMLIDSSEKIFYKVYFGRWYTAPAKTQRMLIVLLQKTIEPSCLSFNNLITGSVQVCATIVQTAVSYFTMVYSVKQSSNSQQK